MKLYEFPIIQKRYVQFLRAIQVVHALLLLVVVFQVLSAAEGTSLFNSGVLLNTGMIALMQFLIGLLKKGQVSLAVTLHQSVTLVFLILQGLLYGGFATSNTAAYHLTLLIEISNLRMF